MANEIIKIAETKIGTPETAFGGLTLCQGLPLFPPFPVIPLGWQSRHGGGLKIGQSFQLLAVKASAGGNFGLQAGLCGPSYAVRFNAEGEVENGTITLAIKEDEAMGGIFFGAGLQAEAYLTAEFYKLYWYWGPHGAWQVALDVRVEAGIDVLKAALDIIAAILQVEDMVAEVVVEGATETPLAMIGEADDEFALKRGIIDMNCAFAVPINLWTLIVVAAAATTPVPWLNAVSAAILAVHEALDVTLSSIGFGPRFGLAVPVSIEIGEVSVDGVKFNKKEVTADGKWVGTLDNAAAVVPSSPKEIKFTIYHRAGFDFRVGLYAEIQLVEIFHIGAAVDCGVLGLFGIKPMGNSYPHTLMNTIGNDRLTAGCGCSRSAEGLGLVDVEFI